MRLCFGEQNSADKEERNYRFLEEALELVQSLGMTRQECVIMVKYVYDRPVGVPVQEVGGVEVTLAALCEANRISKEAAGDTELDRISNIDVINRIRLKQASKPQRSPLPGVV
jgi:exonuclease I